MSNQKQELNLSSEEKEILSKYLGSKLALLVTYMDLADDAKELLLELLPNLEEEDLINFVNFLEEKFASEQTELSDIEFENELSKLAIKYGKTEKEIDEITIKKMDNLFEDFK